MIRKKILSSLLIAVVTLSNVTSVEAKEKVWTTANVNVRKMPSLKSKIIDTLCNGTKVTKLGETGNWTIVKYKNKERYMYSNYLSEKKPKDKIYLGEYKTTAYCNCPICCGKWAWGLTASGTTPQEGRTVACNTLKAGTKIQIGKQQYTVEDTGHLGDEHIDIYFDSHEVAEDYGVKYKDVFLLK